MKVDKNQNTQCISLNVHPEVVMLHFTFAGNTNMLLTGSLRVI